MTKTPDAMTAYEVEQFLFEEADLLDERRFDEWVGLFTPDIRYFVPVRTNRNTRERGLEFNDDHQLAHFDDNLDGLKLRVKRLGTGLAWAEEPPSRTRHLVSNVRVRETDSDDLEVTSNIFVYQSRLERQEHLFAGKRVDRLRPGHEGRPFGIAARSVYLDHTIIPSASLSIFF